MSHPKSLSFLKPLRDPSSNPRSFCLLSTLAICDIYYACHVLFLCGFCHHCALYCIKNFLIPVLQKAYVTT